MSVELKTKTHKTRNFYSFIAAFYHLRPCTYIYHGSLYASIICSLSLLDPVIGDRCSGWREREQRLAEVMLQY